MLLSLKCYHEFYKIKIWCHVYSGNGIVMVIIYHCTFSYVSFLCLALWVVLTRCAVQKRSYVELSASGLSATLKWQWQWQWVTMWAVRRWFINQNNTLFDKISGHWFVLYRNSFTFNNGKIKYSWFIKF